MPDLSITLTHDVSSQPIPILTSENGVLSKSRWQWKSRCASGTRGAPVFKYWKCTPASRPADVFPPTQDISPQPIPALTYRHFTQSNAHDCAPAYRNTLLPWFDPCLETMLPCFHLVSSHLFFRSDVSIRDCRIFTCFFVLFSVSISFRRRSSSAVLSAQTLQWKLILSTPWRY